MDRQPSGGSGASSSSGSQRKALKRPWCTSDNPPSSAPEESPPALPKQSIKTRPGMSASGALAQLLAHWSAFDGEDSAGSESPEEDLGDFENPTSSESLSRDSGDLESPTDDSEDLESSAEDSEDLRSPTEEPRDNESPAKDSLAPDSDKPAELVSPAVLKSLRGRFTNVTLDHQLPCTAAEGTTCQIFSHLSAWNEFLFQVSLQLRETSGTTGNLALVYCWQASLTDYSSEQQRHQVNTLVYWLLKTHCCIVCVQLYVPEVEPYWHFLCDALQGNSHIKSVKLSFGGCWSRPDFVLDIPPLSNLEELECTGYLKPTATLVTTLSRFLRTSKSLRSLRISGMTLKGPNVEDFFGALGENRSLQELALPDSVITKATTTARAVFVEFLKNTTSLKTLSFAADRKVYACVQCILEGLLENKSVVSISFKGLPVDQAAIELMAKIFIQNRVLRSFTVSYKHGYRSNLNSFVEDPPTESDFGHLLKAFVQNSTLEQVSLPVEFWNAKQWKAVFKALPAKESLKMVTIEAPDESTPVLLKISAALERTGAEEKVSFKASFMDEHPDKKFDCKAFSEAVVYAMDCNSTALCGFLERLPSLSHIKFLQLEFDDVRFGKDLSLALTTFLGETRTLRTLYIGAAWEGSLYCFQDAIVKGVSINTSLKKVCIRVMQVKGHFSDFAKALAVAVRSSKNISSVVFDVDGNPYAEHAFLQRLSAGITNNYTLLKVKLSGSVYHKTGAYWFQVWDVMQRNLGLVTAAVDFVRGVRRDRHCALALEQVHRHPGLVEEVARLESVDEARAAAIVREGFRIMAAMPDFV